VTLSITPDQFSKLENELITSHQVVLTCTSASAGVMQSTDGKIEAKFSFTPSNSLLEVDLTKHDGYPGFIANAGLKSKLEAAIKAL
jgi:hypothetical protein